MTTQRITKQTIDVLGGIGSILAGFMCVGIGWMDYAEGRAWHIWAVMTVVLLFNGFAMLRHASRQQSNSETGEGSSRTHTATGVRARL